MFSLHVDWYKCFSSEMPSLHMLYNTAVYINGLYNKISTSISLDRAL